MDVALLYPEVYEIARFKKVRKEFPPLGVLNLAAAIEEAGHDVTVFPVSPGNERIDLRGFAAVGFSLSASATVTMMRTAREMCRIDDNALVMVGGLHCALYPRQTLWEFTADVAVIGQCEQTIGAILAAGHRRDFRGIPGVALPVRTVARITGLRTGRGLRGARHPSGGRVGRRLVEVPHPPQRPALVGRCLQAARGAGIVRGAAGIRRGALQPPGIDPRSPAEGILAATGAATLRDPIQLRGPVHAVPHEGPAQGRARAGQPRRSGPRTLRLPPAEPGTDRSADSAAGVSRPTRRQTSSGIS
jgi:hypothetical protein